MERSGRRPERPSGLKSLRDIEQDAIEGLGRGIRGPCFIRVKVGYTTVSDLTTRKPILNLKLIAVAAALGTTLSANAKAFEFSCATEKLSPASTSKVIHESVKSCIDAKDYAAAAKLYILGSTYNLVDFTAGARTNKRLRDIVDESSYMTTISPSAMKSLNKAMDDLTLKPEGENACDWLKEFGAPTYLNLEPEMLEAAWKVRLRKSPACDPVQIEELKRSRSH